MVKSVDYAARVVVLIGPPGVGKGAQARLLAARDGLAHLSMGDALRDEIARDTPLGSRIRAALDAGCFADDEAVVDLVRGRLAQRLRRGFVLDGFPRSLPQAAELERLVDDVGARLEAAILLDIPERVALARLEGRRVCSQCSATYHVAWRRPRHGGICDRCGARLARRPDDAPDVQRRRLATYSRVTQPLIEYYEQRGLLRRVDADQSIQSVGRRIRQVLTTSG